MQYTKPPIDLNSTGSFHCRSVLVDGSYIQRRSMLPLSQYRPCWSIRTVWVSHFVTMGIQDSVRGSKMTMSRLPTGKTPAPSSSEMSAKMTSRTVLLTSKVLGFDFHGYTCMLCTDRFLL